jgi:predicted ATPase
MTSGPQRLKDLSAPERIHQLGDEDFPPLKTLHQTNLPITATPFLGRERELPEVLGLLSQEEVRLLTLTGPGGTGKTRLALQAAALSAERYTDGVWWIPLAPLRDPELVLTTASQALGAKDGLVEHIADKEMLVLFDNFEQVVDAAPDMAQLLARCPRLVVLVTSREPLRISGEQEYPVPPLVHEEGVGFFIARARAASPDFEPNESVSEICRRLDDLPLALELAAARIKSLSPRQILGRLEQRLPLLTGGARDAPERQRTLRATIEWSYELLDEDEQRLFGTLGVFRGGCTLDAAERVAGADLETLQSLIDKSLVRQRRERYWMLETIREFAAERVDDQIRSRHAEHFVALAEEAEPHLRRNAKEWLDRLEVELDNLRAADDHFEATGKTQFSLRITGALSRFWYVRGYIAEARRRLESALSADDSPTPARARALVGAAIMAVQVSDPKTRTLAEEALVLHREHGDAVGAAYATFLLGHATAQESGMEAALPLYEESMRTFEELGEDHFARLARRVVAYGYDVLGDYERARALHEQNLELARAAGDRRIEAQALGPLAILAVEEGRPRDAIPLLPEVYRIESELGDRQGVAINLCRFAHVLAIFGQPHLAAQLIGCSDARFEEIGSDLAWVKEMNDETLERARADIADSTLAEALASGRRLTVEQAVALAIDALERA